MLQAAALGEGGEIFVLDMGEPVKILDLAHDLIRLSGLSASEIRVKIIGPRPGEKIFEQLYFDDERTLPTAHPKIHAAYHRPYSFTEVCDAILELKEMVHQPSSAIRRKLNQLVPEYTPVSGINGNGQAAGDSSSYAMEAGS